MAAPKIFKQYSSPNYAIREKNIKYIVLHYTEMTFTGALERLCDKESNVSAHYLIKADGTIYQLVEDKHVAWHAGISYWRGEEKLNQNSIGIEMDNSGRDVFPNKQMSSCADLCLYLMDKYNIKSGAVIGHSDIAPDRKIDPGIFFDWQYLAKRGVGIIPAENAQVNVDIDIKSAQQILTGIGYKIDVTGVLDQQTSNVLRAFQSRFCPQVIHQLGVEYYNNLDNHYGLDDTTKRTLLKFK